jgi:hypothetical protein
VRAHYYVCIAFSFAVACGGEVRSSGNGGGRVDGTGGMLAVGDASSPGGALEGSGGIASGGAIEGGGASSSGGTDAAAPGGGRKLRDLTAAEASRFCNDSRADMEALFDAECTALGLSRGEGQAVCENQRAQCQAGRTAGVRCDAIDISFLHACTLDVATVRSCLAALGVWANSFSCTSIEGRDSTNGRDEPPCNAALVKDCPGFGVAFIRPR